MTRIARERRAVRLIVPDAAGVAERWRKQYQHPVDGWSRSGRSDARATYEAIADLGDKPDPDAVAKIIGNKSWTHPTCSCCREYRDEAVQFADGYYGDSDTPLICRTCLDTAREFLADPRQSDAEPSNG